MVADTLDSTAAAAELVAPDAAGNAQQCPSASEGVGAARRVEAWRWILVGTFSMRLQVALAVLLVLFRLARRTVLVAVGPPECRMQALNRALLEPALGLSYDVHSGKILTPTPCYGWSSTASMVPSTGAESTGM